MSARPIPVLAGEALAEKTLPLDPGAEGRRTKTVSALAGLLAFASFVSRTAAAPYLLDSAEFASASFGLGIAHPPGESLALLWGQLFCWLPFGSVAFRVGVSQGAAGALATVVVFHLALELLMRIPAFATGRSGLKLVLSSLAAAGFAGAPGLIMNANRPEVYALGALLGLGSWLLALRALRAQRPGDVRLLFAAAFLVGLGVSLHSLMAATGGLGVLVLAWPHLRGATLRVLAGVALAGSTGLLVWLYLPVRAAALFTSPVNAADAILWGDGRSLSGIMWILSAQTFRSKMDVVYADSDPGAMPMVILEELGLVLPLLALVALYGLLRMRGQRLVALALTVPVMALIGYVAPILDIHNPDMRGYLLGAQGALAALGVCGLGFIVSKLSTLPAALIFGLCAFVTVVLRPLIAPMTDSNDLRHRFGPSELVQATQDEVPLRGSFISAHYETAFLMSYARLVEGQRPDLTWVHAGFFAGPGYLDRQSRAYPLVLPLVEAYRRGDVESLVKNGSPGLRLEPSEQTPATISAALRPGARLWGLDPHISTKPLPLVSPEILGEASVDRQERGYLAWRAFRDAELACRRGLKDLATLRLTELKQLLPADRMAQQLAASCLHN